MNEQNQQHDVPLDPALRLYPGQQELTPAQQAEASRFAEAGIHTQLSTDSVDEVEAETLLRQAYAAVKLAPPRHIHWLDGPLELVAVLGHDEAEIFVEDGVKARVHQCVWDDASREGREMRALCEGSRAGVPSTVDFRVSRIWEQVEKSLPPHFRTNSPAVQPGWSVWSHVSHLVWERVRDEVGWNIWRAVADSVGPPLFERIWDRFWDRADFARFLGIRAYYAAHTLAGLRFYDTYFVPNQARSLSAFNQLVSGYWLGRNLALVVRRPRLLSRDESGRLHSASGKAVEYHDGWGCYVWHGTPVPKRFILAPEELSREDFLNEPNIEMRRVIQERMGARFVEELGGTVLDAGPRGTLYAVDLPDDPEEVAYYVQVQDASTARQYYLRVPPTVLTAEEAVAWTFSLNTDEYRPAQES
jgi:hypothetical protein